MKKLTTRSPDLESPRTRRRELNREWTLMDANGGELLTGEMTVSCSATHKQLPVKVAQ